MTWEHLGPIFGRDNVDFTLFFIGFVCGLEGISGLCREGSRVTWDHLGLILGHPVAIFEVMLHRKACELENMEFTLVL